MLSKIALFSFQLNNYFQEHYKKKPLIGVILFEIEEGD